MLAAILLSVSLYGQAPQVESLVDANANAIGLIQSLDVTFDHRLIGDPKAVADRVAREHWLRKGLWERFRSEASYMAPTADGRPTNIREWVLSEEGYRLLLNWDPQHPQKIRPLFQGTLRAEIGPRLDRNPTGINPAWKLLFETEQFPRRSLSGLVSSVSRTEMLGEDHLAGRRCWVLKVETAPEPRVKTLEFWLDPAANFMIARRIERDPDFANANGETGFAAVATVLEFKEFGDGIFFPMKIEIRACTGRDCDPLVGAVNSLIEVKSLEINPRIPEERFQLSFPKYAAVKNLPPVNGRVGVDIWGDGKPFRRANSLEDIQAIEEDLMQAPEVRAEFAAVPYATLRPPRQVRGLAYVIVPVLLIAIATAVALRIRRRT